MVTVISDVLTGKRDFAMQNAEISCDSPIANAACDFVIGNDVTSCDSETVNAVMSHDSAIVNAATCRDFSIVNDATCFDFEIACVVIVTDGRWTATAIENVVLLSDE